jgi:hypothetical protein
MRCSAMQPQCKALPTARFSAVGVGSRLFRDVFKSAKLPDHPTFSNYMPGHGQKIFFL